MAFIAMFVLVEGELAPNSATVGNWPSSSPNASSYVSGYSQNSSQLSVPYVSSFPAASSRTNSDPSSAAGSGTGSTLSSAGNSPASSTNSTPSAPPTAVAPSFHHPAKMVVGYYGGWSAYSGFTPDRISASNLDVLNYAFAKIGTDLKIAAGDPYIDEKNFKTLNSLKKSYSNLKTVISIGGWDDSGRFSDAALTESSRAVFADSVVEFIRTYGFDGVDIDWEYPTGGGLSSNASRPADKTNFGLLLKTLRSKLDASGAKDGKHYILSFAGAANSGYAGGVGLSTIAQYVDYGIIMTYDLHGGWDSFTDFNAPLFLPAGQSPQYKISVDLAVRSWLNYGFPAGKLVMGVPFYGYAYQGTVSTENGLWQRFSSTSTVGYDSIQSKYLNNASYAKFYDSSALVPWIFNGSTFISYDDAESLQHKVKYAVSKNLLGVSAWELGFDKSGALIGTIQKALG